MKNKTINEAAKAYALEQLGEVQYKNNKDAVRAITDDFKAGVKWLEKHQKQIKN